LDILPLRIFICGHFCLPGGKTNAHSFDLFILVYCTITFIIVSGVLETQDAKVKENCSALNPVLSHIEPTDAM
jgi:hypothetical protein